MEQIYEQIEERNDIIPSTGSSKLELIQTREQNIATEHTHLLLDHMLLKVLVYVSCNEAIVYDVDIYRFKKVLIGHEQALNVDVSVEKKIIQLKVIVDKACSMDSLQDVHQLNTERVHLLFTKPCISILSEMLYCLSKFWHYHVVIDR